MAMTDMVIITGDPGLASVSADTDLLQGQILPFPLIHSFQRFQVASRGLTEPHITVADHRHSLSRASVTGQEIGVLSASIVGLHLLSFPNLPRYQKPIKIHTRIPN